MSEITVIYRRSPDGKNISVLLVLINLVKPPAKAGRVP